ncbi:MAG: dienelactone hydrolase family protein [Anaerolineaceae bacterium]|nr:dienelactone hydrolase family protein [Anaerolineaceae bacterium]
MDTQTRMVEFRGNGDMVPGFLARPADGGDYPAAVVIQEWWGLNDHIKDVARRLAAEGFVTLAPDLYRGQVAEEPDEARKLAMELDRDRAIKDIQGAVDYLVGLPGVTPQQAGIVGFCMGGGLAAWMASVGQQVGAVAVFYGGRAPLTDDEAQDVSAAFLGIYGEKDGSIPLEVIHNNEQKLKAHHKPCEFIIYPDAPHAFFNDTRQSYRPEAAADAWRRTLDWFRQYLQ